MSRSRWLLGVLLAAKGCAETVGTSPVDGPVGGFDAVVVSVLPPTDDRTSPTLRLSPTSDPAAPASCPLGPSGWPM